MKFILIALFASSVFAKPGIAELSKALNEEVKSDIKKDEDKFKKNIPVMRKPASLGPSADAKTIQEERKIDKTVKQLGNQSW